EQVGGEGMAQPVWVRGQAAEGAGVEPAAACGEEERVLRAPRELRPPLAKVAAEAECRLLAERHRPLLAALPANVEELLIEVHVPELEADRLGAAQAGGVDQ